MQGALKWRDGKWVREDNRPAVPEVSEKDRHDLVTESVKELEAAAIELGVSSEHARDAAREHRKNFRVNVGPVGTVVSVRTHGAWSSLMYDDAIRHLAHQILTDTRKEKQEDTPPPTKTELVERFKRQAGADYSNGI